MKFKTLKQAEKALLGKVVVGSHYADKPGKVKEVDVSDDGIMIVVLENNSYLELDEIYEVK